jgi:xylulokinase
MTFLGIDCGTSALKAVFVDADQRILASAVESYSPSHPRPLWSEQDPADWREAMFAALANLARQAPEAARALRGIGFSGQMHSAVLLDAADRPLRPAILHNDTRAFAEAAELAAQHPGLAGVLGVKPMAGFTAPKIVWLRRNEPENFARLACVLLPKDYLRLCLTGEKAIDMSDAAGMWLLDEARRSWSAEALDAVGLAPSALPQLVEGSQPAGALRDAIADRFGFPRGIVVAAGGGDAAVGAVGIGATSAGQAFISLGTSVQLIAACDDYRAAPEKLVHSFAHALPGRWYRMAAMLNGAGALAFAGRLFGASAAELEAVASRDYPGPGEALFLPYLSGERTPHDDPRARGVYFGLTPSTSRADLARATMEGVACSLADARECLEAGGSPLGAIGLIGGGSRSALWTRMIAAATERPILRYGDGAAGPAFGAARLGRLAVTGEDARAVCRAPDISDVTEPDPRLVEKFRKSLTRFRRLYQALKPEFQRDAEAPGEPPGGAQSH